MSPPEGNRIETQHFEVKPPGFERFPFDHPLYIMYSSGTTGAPMTYMHKGKQFIIVPVGAKDHPAEFIALALPDVKPSTAGNR